MDYPFQPKSIRRLRTGHFWAIPLDDGRYACGLVVEADVPDQPSAVMAALLDWVGADPPTLADIEQVNEILDHGTMGYKGIAVCGDMVRGRRDMDKYPIVLPETLTHQFGRTVGVLRGTEVLRLATDEDKRSLAVSSALGFKVLQIRANDAFATGCAKPEDPEAG